MILKMISEYELFLHTIGVKIFLKGEHYGRNQF